MNRTRLLIQTSAVYALIGAGLGAHIAGSGDYILKPIHAHILVVGWLSLFSFAVFYKLFSIPSHSRLAQYHVASAFLGTLGLSGGMWLQYVVGNTFSTAFFIVGGSILFISFGLFLLMTFIYRDIIK